MRDGIPPHQGKGATCVPQLGKAKRRFPNLIDANLSNREMGAVVGTVPEPSNSRGATWIALTQEGPHGSHVISPSALRPSKRRGQKPQGPHTDPRLSSQSDPNRGSWRSEAPRVCYLGTAAPTSTVVGVRSPKGLQTGYN
ncbi:hypothetical protein PanWU01x14_177300 [Parasponia andersonii]|uniref:Uncharacterized protein n=1 Tax=Parasponia andersonii TaxID=3476 RepID=A0A2P5C7F2_PARAD|nr:hypothetical protein PanWU01x14_177300 [Parasponia andersonii]